MPAVGGGVCGLTCAIALLKEGVDVHVYEAAVSQTTKLRCELIVLTSVLLSPNSARLELELVWVSLTSFQCCRVIPNALDPVGRNAVRVLTALGVYDDIRARARQTDQIPVDQPNHQLKPTDEDDKRGWFEFISGLPGHEVQCDVRMNHVCVSMNATD